MEVTIANMIDRLITASLKIYMLENVKRDPVMGDHEIAEATRKTNSLNVERNALIDSIDKSLNKLAEGEQQKLFGSNKMYGS